MAFFGCCGNAPRKRRAASAKGAFVWFQEERTAPGDPAATSSQSTSANATSATRDTPQESISPGQVTGSDRRPSKRGGRSPMAEPADKDRKIKMGEVQKDNIKSVRELLKLMQSRDEETRKKNEDLTVKNSSARQFAVVKGRSREVRKAPLHF